MGTSSVRSSPAGHAEHRIAQRRAAMPAVSYPPALPISQHKDEIAAAVRDHQVVVVAGTTGSGKTTQLPKICLELGRGVQGMIGHTQPRRLAARTVAERIAAELETPLGGAVGYQVRFAGQVGDGTLVKLMTDGILLAEIGSDRLLRRYDTLIIDEAHERSLNIDFILGYLTQLLPRRPDLKVVITSATIDPQRFSRHFGGAPVIEVSGRTYPVEIRYRPIADPEAGDADPDRDQPQAICDAVAELAAEGPGDVLVFASGEREIRDAAEALARANLPDTEVVPLYARLSASEQHRVFAPHPGRRIVVATNVAETSLTVPGIRYVIDPGNARISRYSHRTKVQRLPIEAVSQASASQRAGRCGRTSAGICLRLYSSADFEARPAYTDPEILRTNLASVILQMTALGLGDVASFPFLDPPDRRNIAAGVQLLVELGAVELGAVEPAGSGQVSPAQPGPGLTSPGQAGPEQMGPAQAGSGGRIRLTPLGRKLAQLPIDPRLARMVLEADRHGCVREVMVVAAALSIQDPRERPADRQQAADEMHARFAEPDSDFLAYLNLWRYLREQQQALSGSQFRKLCRAEFLSYLRVREWQDLVSQLRQLASTVGISVASTPGDAQAIHLSLLAGLLSHIGGKVGPAGQRQTGQRQAGRKQADQNVQRQDYLGARNTRFAIFPGSALAKKQPRWVMAAELVETSRLWGRVVARIEPEWAESLAGHLVKRSYSEPHWEKTAGAVLAYEKVTLYGVPLVTGRKVGYATIDPELCRELFIRHALVEGDWRTHHQFFADNRRALAEVEDLQRRVRRRNILVDEQALFDFYDQRVGPEVVSARHFDAWWKKVRRTAPDLLTFEPSMLLGAGAGDIHPRDYPDCWEQDGLALRLSYAFEPGSDTDGVSVHIPLPVLGRVDGRGFDWQVPGLREELVTALIRSLPKPVRQHFVPVPDHARAVLAALRPGAEPLLPALGRELGRLTGVPVPPDAWQLDRVPDHLKITFRVLAEDGSTLAEGKDLATLKRRLAPALQASLAAAAGGLERRGLHGWEIGTLPRTLRLHRGGYPVTGYPALVDERDCVAVRVFETGSQQRRAMWPGTRRLLLLGAPPPARLVASRLTSEVKLALLHSPHGSLAALLEDCAGCAADTLIAEHGGPAWDERGFGALREAVHARLADALLAVLGQVHRILAASQAVEARLADRYGAGVAPVLSPALDDIRAQRAGLVYPGFVTATGQQRLPDVLRYLQAIDRRLAKLPDNPDRDRAWMGTVHRVQQAYQDLLAALPPDQPAGEDLLRIRWMIEELRVSFFAQTLGTAYPVSDKRIYRAMDELAP
jgi:ATP-dependent helicase HrpA